MAISMDGELQIILRSTWQQTLIQQTYRKWLIKDAVRSILAWNEIAPYEINVYIKHNTRMPEISFFIGKGEFILEKSKSSKEDAYIIPSRDIPALHHRLSNVLTFLALEGWSLQEHAKIVEQASRSDKPLVFLPSRYHVRDRTAGEIVESYCESVRRVWDI